MIHLGMNTYQIEEIDLQPLFYPRKKESHKGNFGIAGIMGGSLEYSGAIKLANLSAIATRGGCGIVRVLVPDYLSQAITPYLLEQTLYPLKTSFDHTLNITKAELKEAIKNTNSLAIGMGWGRDPSHQTILTTLLEEYSGNLIIDADGLNTLAQMDKTLLKKAKGPVILTPHLKEFSRLTNLPIETIQQDTKTIAQNFAKEYGIILLLKGSTTIVTDGNITYLSMSGSPGMATAGSGDVLSGILVSMLAYQANPLLAVVGSAYLAGLAGELAQAKYTDIAMKASDTIEFIPQAIKQIRNLPEKKG